MKQIRLLVLSALFVLLVSGVAAAAKTVFQNGDKSLGIQGTKVTAEYLNAVNNHRHDGQATDGSGILDYYLDTGTVNAVIIAPLPALTAHVPGLPLWFKAVAANTGGGTITVNALPAVPLVRPGGAALVGGDITAGQICQAAWDGTKYQLLGAAAAGGNLIGRQILTSGTTYTPTVGTKSIIVELVGGGGGGGGVNGALSNSAFASGGSGGAYAKRYFINIAGTYSYSIGQGGVGGSSGGGNGAIGQDTIFTGPGSLTVVAGGGQSGIGGTYGTTPSITPPGSGPVATGGDINVPGASGGSGIRLNGTMGFSGNGGPSPFGQGGIGTSYVGIPGRGYGSGGGGAATTNDPGGAIGGAGMPGLIIVWEYK